MTGLPPSEVLLDAAAVLRQLADAATPGRRHRFETVAMAGDVPVGLFSTEGDAGLWAAFGPDEARLLADLLAMCARVFPDKPEALDLAYALTGHQRHPITSEGSPA